MDVPLDQIISFARAQAGKMHAATASAAESDSVWMQRNKFRELADLIVFLSGLADQLANQKIGSEECGSLKEAHMAEDELIKSTATLAKIANAIISAEASFLKAEEGIREAERNRQEALDTLARLRSEIDVALGQVGRKSSENAESGRPDRPSNDILTLKEEDSFPPKPNLEKPKFGQG